MFKGPGTFFSKSCLAVCVMMMSACGKDSKSIRGPERSTEDVQAALALNQDVSWETEALDPVSDVRGFSFAKFTRYSLPLSQDTSVGLAPGASVSMCPIGSQSQGPFVTLLKGDDVVASDDTVAFGEVTTLAGFPAQLSRGDYTAMVSFYGASKDCLASFSFKLIPVQSAPVPVPSPVPQPTPSPAPTPKPAPPPGDKWPKAEMTLDQSMSFSAELSTTDAIFVGRPYARSWGAEYALSLQEQVVLYSLDYNMSRSGDCWGSDNMTSPEVAIESKDGQIKVSTTPFRPGFKVIDLDGYRLPAGSYRVTFLISSELDCSASGWLELRTY